jgi:copper(I)-binding protein
MQIRYVSTVLALVFGGMSLVAVAGTAADAVQVTDPYVRAVPPGQPNSAAFMQLTNQSDTDHTLVAAESPVAQTVELHTHVMEEGMMKMRRIEKIDLPAGQQVGLQPGGLHIMLIGLKQDLQPDAQVALTLVFEDGSKSEIQAPVRMLQMQMSGTGGMQHPH